MRVEFEESWRPDDQLTRDDRRFATTRGTRHESDALRREQGVTGRPSRGPDALHRQLGRCLESRTEFSGAIRMASRPDTPSHTAPRKTASPGRTTRPMRVFAAPARHPGGSAQGWTWTARSLERPPRRGPIVALAERVHAISSSAARRITRRRPSTGCGASPGTARSLHLPRARTGTNAEVCDVRLQRTRRTSTTAPCGRRPSTLRKLDLLRARRGSAPSSRGGGLGQARRRHPETPLRWRPGSRR